MANFASALKAEIARVARKEIRGEIQSLRVAAASHRRDVAALKRRLQQLERQFKSVSKTARLRGDKTGEANVEGSDRQVRFSAVGLAKHRKKLGLSAAKYALLLNSSSLSVYKWESGQTRPRQAQVEAIAAVKKLGKKEATERLEHLEAAA